MPYIIVNGQMVDAPVGYNPVNPQDVVQAQIQQAQAQGLPNPWANRNVVAPPNPWGYQYDPRGQTDGSFNRQQIDAYQQWADQRTGQLPINTAPITGLAGQQYAAGTLQPVTQAGQAQAAQNVGSIQGTMTQPTSTSVGSAGRSTPGGTANTPDMSQQPSTGGRQTPGGSAGTQGQQPSIGQPMAPPPDPGTMMQQAQQAMQQALQMMQTQGYGVPFSQSYVPPQAFSGMQVPNFGSMFQGMNGGIGMGAPAGGFGGLGGMAVNPQTGMAQGVGSQLPINPYYGNDNILTPAMGNGFQMPRQQSYQTQMFQPFGQPQGQQQQGIDLNQLLLMLLGGGR